MASPSEVSPGTKTNLKRAAPAGDIQRLPTLEGSRLLGFGRQEPCRACRSRCHARWSVLPETSEAPSHDTACLSSTPKATCRESLLPGSPTAWPEARSAPVPSHFRNGRGRSTWRGVGNFPPQGGRFNCGPDQSTLQAAEVAVTFASVKSPFRCA